MRGRTFQAFKRKCQCKSPGVGLGWDLSRGATGKLAESDGGGSHGGWVAQWNFSGGQELLQGSEQGRA